MARYQDEVAQGWAGRHVGQDDIDALWQMCATFTDVDQRLGGGYARSTLLHYVNHVVLPLLQGSYDDAIGRELMAATARLCDLCGYMSWDSGKQGLAQRYFIQALRLAQASGDRALGAHILVDMAQQAHSLGDTTQALDLASAGLDCGATGLREGMLDRATSAGSSSPVRRAAVVQVLHSRTPELRNAAHGQRPRQP